MVDHLVVNMHGPMVQSTYESWFQPQALASCRDHKDSVADGTKPFLARNVSTESCSWATMTKSSMRSYKRMFHDVPRVRGELLSERKPSFVSSPQAMVCSCRYDTKMQKPTVERAAFFLRIVLLQVDFILGSARVKVQKKFNLCIRFARLLMRFPRCENMPRKFGCKDMSLIPLHSCREITTMNLKIKGWRCCFFRCCCCCCRRYPYAPFAVVVDTLMQWWCSRYIKTMTNRNKKIDKEKKKKKK